MFRPFWKRSHTLEIRSINIICMWIHILLISKVGIFLQWSKSYKKATIFSNKKVYYLHFTTKNTCTDLLEVPLGYTCVIHHLEKLFAIKCLLLKAPVSWEISEMIIYWLIFLDSKWILYKQLKYMYEYLLNAYISSKWSILQIHV